MMDIVSDRRSAAAGMLLFATIIALIGWDLIEDYRSGITRGHLLMELTVLVFGAIGFVYLWQRFIVACRTARSLRRDLETARREARRWRGESEELIRGLGEAIERQFGRWKLTTAEADVGLLLLKGLSHKEIASIRSTSERTVRQQARALYSKARLAGRAELSAFFLEDLLLPHAALPTGGSEH